VRRPALLLLFLSFLTFVLGLGRPAISDSDEAYYAEAAREMVQNGDWLTPRYNYEYRWQKPVLYYWLTAITSLIFGVGEWTARCWSALCGVGLVFVTAAAARQFTSRPEVSWLAGAITATSYGYFAIARLALPDLPLAFFVTVTIWAALDNRWMLAGLAAGLGFLTKGPVALVVPAIVFAPIWFFERRTRHVRPVDLAGAALVFAVVGLPWYLAMLRAHGVGYLESFFIGDNLERFATDRFNQPRSPFFYIPILLGGLMPWTGFVLAALRAPIRDLVSRRRRLTSEERALMLWAVMPLLFFTAAIGKQPRYILPVLPPVAILLARALVQRVDRARAGERAARLELTIAAVATGCALAFLGVLLYRAAPLFVTAYRPLTWTGVAVLAGSAVALWICAALRAWTRLPLLMPALSALTLLSLQFGALSGVRPESAERMASLVLKHRVANEAVGEYQVFVRNLVYYVGFPQIDLTDERRAVDFLRSSERVLMVVRKRDVARLEALSGVTPRTLGAVEYLNTANLKVRTLLWPLPDQHIERVLLVSNR
jgi:4-amino-4-deoxy-L-arabinose transferase-like glycosyltransferase